MGGKAEKAEEKKFWKWNGSLEEVWARKFLEEYLLKNERQKDVINVGIMYDGFFQDFDRAMELFKRAIEMEPKEIRPYRKLADLYKRLDRLQEAADIYEKMLEIEPSRTK